MSQFAGTKSSARSGRLATLLLKNYPTLLAYVVCFLVAVLALRLNKSQLLTAYDGSVILEAARQQFALHTPIWNASLNFLTGLSDIYYPLNYRLFPGFVFANLLDFGDAGRIALYAEVMVELFLAVLLLANALRFSMAVSVAGACAYCVLTIPFYGMSLIWSNNAVGPHTGTILAATTAVNAMFIMAGTRSSRINLFLAVSILLLGLWLALASILSFVVYAPIIVIVFSLWLIAARGSRSEFYWKAGIVVTGLALAVLPVIYLYGMTTDTAAAFFPDILVNTRAAWVWSSVAFQWSPISLGYNAASASGPVLVPVALLGAIVELMSNKARAAENLRLAAKLTLGYFAGIILFSVYMIYGSWRGPAAFYYEHAIIPFYCLFATQLLAVMGAKLHVARLPRLLRKNPGAPVLLATAIVLFGLGKTTTFSPFRFAFPPRTNAIVDRLRDDIALPLGVSFRGRLAVLNGRRFDKGLAPLDLWMESTFTAVRIGNDMNISGLEYFNIPHLYSYTATITPAYFTFMAHYFADDRDTQQRNGILMRKINPKMLGLIGVSLILTDTEFSGEATLIDRQKLGEADWLLYRIPANLGTYSPTHVRNVGTATEILQTMDDVGFDPAKTVVTEANINIGALTRATTRDFSFHGESLHISAQGGAPSILILPLEYSDCLQTTDRKSTVTLFRADLILTGVMFSGEIDSDIFVHTGPFTNPACRLRDRAEQKRLKLEDVPFASHF